MKQRWFGVMIVGGMVAVMAPMIVLAAGGSAGGFEAVVHGIEQRYNTQATQIPFMGLMSGIVRISTHGNVKGIHVAEFEHFDSAVDGDELNTLVTQRAGKGWQRIVRETSRSGGDQSLIFVRPEGDHMGMLVVDLDGREMDVVQISVNPEELAREVSKHSGHHNETEAAKDDGMNGSGKHLNGQDHGRVGEGNSEDSSDEHN
ncbi:hypothetical protein [Acidicapsa ligni]|uniref:hypothetical protein n=1 Tax=Acidicapsa ligni TaxID=542300 RepID=UPI0021E0A1D1|nr:hypothetical protein [Acidicapsa ligni]